MDARERVFKVRCAGVHGSKSRVRGILSVDELVWPMTRRHTWRDAKGGREEGKGVTLEINEKHCVCFFKYKK